MDPRIASQRRGAITILIFAAVLFGLVAGAVISSGMGWIPSTNAQSVVNARQTSEVQPSDFLVNTQESWREIVASVRPAVVSIQAVGVDVSGYEYNMPFDFQDPFEFFFGPQNQQRQPQRPQPQQRETMAAGSGFFVSPDGYLLTNNHVITGAEEIKVVLDDGTILDAELLGADPDTDVAVLKVDSDEDFPYISLGDSDQLEVGDWVMAIGNPFGTLAGSVTVGIVSATHREYLNLPNAPDYQNFIQTDAAINLGNSGGPLVDIYGHVVGINTAITAQGSGIGFAIPANMASFVYQSFLEHGEVVRGWIGVVIQNLDADLAQSFGLDSVHGALIAEVQPGDPAEEAGLQAGDILLDINGEEISTVQSASRMIAGLPVDQPAEFLILRDGRQMTIDVTPSQRATETATRARPEDRNETREPNAPMKNEEYLGMEVQELTRSTVRDYNLPEDASGVVVTYVNPSSPAYEKGLREGAVIISINSEPVENLDDYEALMSDAYNAWQDSQTAVVFRYMVYSPDMDQWVRQFMAVPFE
jgi:serine protease Do